ncbi:tenascin-like isoform X2 [Brienomyrus brachyistius]|uniref:tenascin-like isoform X2 n=1 Tax=Brienomyrus brachyistius TaxID=42636 RepID=UPI0020B3434E|nr:tenascin-like isoform X2 [Brienomyrus brachyistius]
MGRNLLLWALWVSVVLLPLTSAGLVQKMFRSRRGSAALPASGSGNISHPDKAKPMVFNHIYSINVTAGALCAVDLQAPDGFELQPQATHISEHAVDGENQIVFTHRINIPRQVCKCVDSVPGLKELLSRLEVLEEEVSALRDQCANGGSCCGAQVTGEVGTKPYCSGRGNYSTDTCSCVCEPGWKGPNCSVAACPNDCLDQGRCVDGECVCFEGFSGPDCGVEVCAVDCGENGRCVNSICICADGYAGEDCSETNCPNNCLGRGRCVDGECVCAEPWMGVDCAEVICPNDCYDLGRCVNGTCFCDEGFIGEDCSERLCPGDCNGRGRCVDGRCECAAGYAGHDCSMATCPNDCNGRGVCSSGVCICEWGYQGPDCGELACPDNCNDRGHCMNGKCICDVGYQGEDCSELSCPNGCRNRGRCVNGLCVCDEGFTGEDCNTQVCPSDCYGRGSCVKGHCVCYAGYTGSDCSELTCPNDCHGHGRCVDGQCVCHEGFAGDDCHQKTCPGDCLDRGVCVDGRCMCQEGFTGNDCSEFTCPGNCNGRGRCVDGQCLCDEGYIGIDCGQQACPDNCNGRGRCVDGQCLCDEGYIGIDCGQQACPDNCNGRGRCVDGQCLCDEGYIGIDCGQQACPDNCNGRGRCVDGQCLCDEGYIGIDCGQQACPDNCNGRGRCVDGQCLCDEGYIGEDCSEVSPAENLTVMEVNPETVNLTWANEMLVTEYLITYVPTAPGGLQMDFRVPGDQNTATIMELEPGIEYLVNVFAVLNNKRSIPISARVATHLPTPEGLKFRSVKDTSMEVLWNPLDIPFDSWHLTFRNTKEDNGAIRNTLPHNTTGFQQSGLAPGQEYEVKLEAVKNRTRGPAVNRNVKTKIDAPSQVEVRDVTDSSALISWFRPLARVDGVTISYGPSKDPSDRKTANLIPTDTQYHIGGLEPDTEYHVSLNSKRGGATSSPIASTFTTELDIPQDLQKVTQTDRTITLEWTNSKADIDKYRVKYGPISGGVHNELLVRPGPGDTTKATISGLRPGTEYGIGVTAMKRERESLPATTNAATDLDPPKDLEVKDSSETSVTLSWKRPRAKIDRYRLGYVTDGQREEVAVPGDATTYVLSGLDPGKKYSVSLSAERGKQRSDPASLSVSTASKSAPSPDVVALSIKIAPTPIPSRAPDSTVVPATSFRTKVPVTHFLSGVSVMEPEASTSELPRGLNLTSVTQMTTGVTQVAPKRSLDNLLVELDALTKPTWAHEVTVPGATKATGATATPVVDDRSLGPPYEVSPHSFSEGEPPPTQQGPANTEEAEPRVVNLTVSDVLWNSFRVSWDTSDEVAFSGFLIEVADSDGWANSQNHTLSGDARSVGIAQLSPNSSYVVSVRGFHRGLLLETALAEVTTVPEPEVGTLLVSNVTSESFTISWNGTEGIFEGFVLEIIDSNWLFEPMEYNLSHNAQSHEITGLSPSTDYVAYLYGVVKGVRTQAVSAVATTATEPHLARLVVFNVTSDRLSLSWRTSAKSFDNFVVEVRESAVPSRAMGRTLPASARSTEISGLRGDTQYDIKLYGNVGGLNTPPLTAVATTEADPQLGSVKVSDIGPDNFTLSWSTVAGHFDGFMVRVSDSEQLYDALELWLPGGARHGSIAGLVDATPYDIELYGISHGLRTPSLTTHAVTAELPKVENLNISDVSPFGFRVSWTARHANQPGGFDHFHLVVTDSGWLLEPQEFMVTGNQTSLDIRGLITGIGYEVQLTGVTKSGQRSRPLTTVAVTEAEPEVEHLFVSDITSESFRLAWTAEDDVFDRFVIKVRDSKKLAHPKEVSVSGQERTKVLTGLAGGTEYEIELYGVTLERRSQPITGVARTALNSPMGIRFSDITDTSTTVHWTKLRTPVDSYRVTYVPIQGGPPRVVMADGTESKAELPNLSPGVAYQVHVVAIKGFEESEPRTDTFTAALDKPRGVTAVNVTDTQALLLWQPAAATVDSYIITYSTGTEPPTVEQVSGNTVEFEMTSLKPGTTYSVSVKAIRGGQRSEPSDTDFTTDVDAPRDLTVTNVQGDHATLTWKPPRTHINGYILSYGSANDTMREVALNPAATSYELSALIPGTTYTVRLRATAGPKTSQPIQVLFSTIGMLYPLPKDCSQTLLNGDTTSDLYTIYMGGEGSQPAQVFCDMVTDGGGWIVFLRRQNGKLNFFRNWKNYTAGFGNIDDEFWLGLANLHKITTSGKYELLVELRDQGESAYALYDDFSVSDPRSRFKIQVGSYSGTAGDSLSYHHGRPFSTYDNDNDIAVTNCALSYKGAFWYKNCHRVNLMGRYGDNSHSKGVNWYHWKGHEHSIEFAEMKIRPINFRNLEGRRKRS